MKHLKYDMQAVMDGTRKPRPPIAVLLFMLSKVYHGVVFARNRLYDRRIMPIRKLPCRVVSIGNICVGGTGKTPMTVYTARLLKAMGCTVSVISRGYKGKAEKAGGIVSDGESVLMDAAHAGDEPRMMAGMLKGVPVIIGSDRYAAGMKAVSDFGAEILVLDDGFQHRRVFRDADLVLLDYRRPFGNSRLLPRGRLREPVEAMARSHGIVATRCGGEGIQTMREHFARQRVPRDKPWFFARHEVFIDRYVDEWEPAGAGLITARHDSPASGRIRDLKLLRQKRVFGFSAIADNRGFFETLCRCSGEVVGFSGFPDHYRYRKSDVDAIIRAAGEKNAGIIVTTRKDAVKLLPGMAWPIPCAVLGLNIVMANEDEFAAFLKERIGK
ncbi:MAG: tetraacyldisaccharide 4'-kinase [Desulfobacterales bacterium]